VDIGRIRAGGGRAVAEIPLIGEGVTIGVAGAGARELHGERVGPAGWVSGRLRHRRVVARGRSSDGDGGELDLRAAAAAVGDDKRYLIGAGVVVVIERIWSWGSRAGAEIP